ncbi:hypothetical protein LWI29_024418 [Acer saccharum]|uniref:Uncharacterized protein n=1 Tax=Acer saccharum TaxID=4024 RepID=A0AA39VGS0_ACESA|nr:hypothetical protein LWI29_024418 [Acer saccharum]
MAGEGDGSNSKYNQGPPGNELEDNATLNAADVTLTTADQSTAIAGIQRFPLTNEEIVQRFQASLQQLISDAARQAVNLSTTEGLTSPHNLPTPNQQTARLCSAVVVPTPDAPLKMGRDPTDRPETLSERQARYSRVHREEDYSDRRYDPDRTGRNRNQPKRRTHRRDRSSSSGESKQYHRHKRQGGTVRMHGLNREIREQSRKKEDKNALVRRYGHNELSDDESGSLFTNGVLRLPFPERFRMPHVEQFKKIPTRRNTSGEAVEARRDLDVNSIEPDPKRIKEGWDPIIFTEADSHGIDVRPNDALVISARIGHREVYRILIDNGSSADILSAEVYDQLRLDRKDLQPFHTPLRGFGGVEVRSLGTVKLPVKVKKAPYQKTILLDFVVVVVDTENWPYNALLGRLFLNKTKAITATYAIMMKFPTEYGVGLVKGSQEMARMANLSVYKDKEVHQIYIVAAE